ncbi:hypothetical protein, partial [uncultured Clostridium sp.]|uniref:hypothetical protein n=1 Tax=uncultured Clostridium sp. TaxID=59620 RepID=UPI00260A7EA4
MKKTPRPIQLEKLKTVSAKKEDKDLLYFYSGYEFNLHQMGLSAKGIQLCRITPLNFDNMLLKTFCKKTFPAKGFSTIENNNVRDFLKLTFDEMDRIKAKKAAAVKAYKKALKEGTLPEEVVVVKVEKPKRVHNDKPYVRNKVESREQPKVSVNSYYTKDDKNSSNRNSDERKSYDRDDKKSYGRDDKKSYGRSNDER